MWNSGDYYLQEGIIHDKFSNENIKLFLLSWIHDKFWTEEKSEIFHFETKPNNACKQEQASYYLTTWEN